MQNEVYDRFIRERAQEGLLHSSERKEDEATDDTHHCPVRRFIVHFLIPP